MRRPGCSGIFQWMVAVCLLVAACGRLPAEEARPTAFKLEAGPAEATLRVFAEQAGTQVIYPAQLVEKISTHAVHGTFTARAALERMLAGTALSVWQDEQTGALAIGKAPAATTKPIELPPFVV